VFSLICPRELYLTNARFIVTQRRICQKSIA